MTNEEIREIIRQNIVKIREESGMNQTDFGLIVGKEKTTVSTWERGDTLPDAATLYRLATYFNKTMDYMYSAHGDNNED